ncbi:Nucleoside-diphosphate-sugar epimerase [Chryseobacterium carnipullorum]|uniref:NAD-dependent epimerase/dehydratase family protein n=1 Tax=Chryseobacterium carnipullorum TaxID=1124835 RepID=UPI000922B0E8|nr:NAD(P)-dependent oxidoreductase [Chryseobacterium carnipullorum]SHN01788.1 Nucleoside-diphosphate-sugar epimerase [Chryseobacterium carnipullorum]
MKLLFTGCNGFVGKNVIPLLREKSFNIKTLGTHDADFIRDIREKLPAFDESFNIVFHAAGKAHSIPKTREEENQFYNVNYEGTKNICQALEKKLPEIFIFISTVAVYGREDGYNISEDFPLEGATAYAKSKIKAEEFLSEWCKRNGVKLFIFRPSLIAGPSAPGNLRDMIRAIKKGRYFNISDGNAKKSIFWVEDFAKLTELTIVNMGGIYNVCDNMHPTFKDVSCRVAELLHKKSPHNIPKFFAKLIAIVGDVLGSRFPINSNKLKKITDSLTFSNEKIKEQLNFSPSNVIENFKI